MVFPVSRAPPSMASTPSRSRASANFLSALPFCCTRSLKLFVLAIAIGVRSLRADRAASFRRARGWQRYCLDLGKIELARSVVDIEADNVAVGVKIGDQPLDNFSRFDTRRAR